MTRERILESNFAAAAATGAGDQVTTGNARRHADRSYDTRHAGELSGFVLFIEILESLRILVEHASLRENRLNDVRRLNLVEIEIQKFMTKPESLGSGRVEFREGVATGGAQRSRTRPFLVLFVERAYSLLETRRLRCRLAVRRRWTRTRMTRRWRGRRLGRRSWRRRRR